MSGNPDQFATDISRWIAKARGNLNSAYEVTAELALAHVKSLTPVRTGFLRASWTITTGDSAAPSGSGDDARQEIGRLKVGERIVLVNPAPYAMRINFGFVGTDSLGRHYNEKGYHMVEKTIAVMPDLARQAVAYVNGEQTAGAK
jgi:hypothetical protein